MNVNYTEAKLFAIRCRIDLVRKLYKALKVVIITNTIPAIKKIFDTLAYLYQLHLIIISKNLREFFNKNPNNLISFQNYSNSIRQSSYAIVDKKLKYININSILSSKTSWKFSRK